jgi:very-short-patch-repair endonuclease
VRESIDAYLEANNGVGTRQQLLSTVRRDQLDDEVRRGHLIRVARHTYTRPWNIDLLDVRELAAQRSLGDEAALSHTTSLRYWDLPTPAPGPPIHVTTSYGRSARSTPTVIVHRSRRPIPTTVVRGVRVMPAAWSIASSWPYLSGPAQRAPIIRAVQRRIAAPTEIRTAVGEMPTVRGRADLLGVLALVEGGSHSELELWGYQRVFDIPVLRAAIRQRAVVVSGKTYVLDLAYEQQRVAVELDGRAFHSAPDQWQRDIARDLALATVGWQTIRLSHRRLTTDVDGCRRDVLSVLAHRTRGR